MRTSCKAALTAAAASLALLTPTLAFADNAVQSDGDTAISGSRDVTYGASPARACATRGVPVPGVVTLKYNGNANDHFTAGEAIDVSVDSGPAGVIVANDPAHPAAVPANWNNGGSIDVSFLTTVSTTAQTGGVVLSVKGHTSGKAAGADTNGNVPGFQVIVNCTTNTKPTVALTGVSNAASYEFGQVPAAVCQASDVEDGNQPGVLALSAITGPLASYGLGSQTATCTYTDAGNLSADPVSATYSIVDTTAPVLVAPASQVIDATSSAGAVATYGAPGVTEAVGLAAGSPSCSPASGTTFGFGETTVTCTASDVAGNATTAVTFTITVKDDTAPTISGGGADATEASGPTTPVDYTLPTANDDVDGPIVPVCAPASGSAFAVGSTQVTCTATDAHGNSSSTSFAIVVTDTTAPAITVPSPAASEATGPDGAVVEYVASASDLVDGTVDVVCTPASGSTFALGTTTVSCSAEDANGNSDTQTFDVSVVDTKPPSLTLPDDITAEATSPSGAVVGFLPTADDIVDGAVAVICSPESGSTFAFGPTTVNCTATDAHENSTPGSFTVTVQDTLPPTISGPTRAPAGFDGVDADGVGWNRTAVTYTWTCADSGSGVVEDTIVKTVSTDGKAQTVSATCEDNVGHQTPSAVETVSIDTVAPVVSGTPSGTLGDNGWYVGDVTVTWSVVENGSGATACGPDTQSADTTGVTFDCQVSDVAGNVSNHPTVAVKRDATSPDVSIVTGPADGATYFFGDPIPATSCSATDATSGLTGACTVTPISGAVGSHTVTAYAKDKAGNERSVTRTYTVGAWTLGGFYNPVNMNGVVNTVKAGSTVPLKFNVYKGSTELTAAIGAVFRAQPISCSTLSDLTDPVEITTTGGTSLRYDSTGHQWIQNWATPSGGKGQCYRVTMTTADGSSLAANFQLK